MFSIFTIGIALGNSTSANNAKLPSISTSLEINPDELPGMLPTSTGSAGVPISTTLNPLVYADTYTKSPSTTTSFTLLIPRLPTIEGDDTSETSITLNPVESPITTVSESTSTPLASPGVSTEPTIMGVVSLLISIICKPEPPSAI